MNTYLKKPFNFFLKTSCCLVVLLLSTVNGYTQDTTTQKLSKRFSFEINTGVPILLGGRIEGITPLFNKRLAVFFAYGKNNLKLTNTGLKITAQQTALAASLFGIPGIDQLIQTSIDQVINDPNTKIGLRYWEYGFQYYLNPLGNGFFMGLNWGSISMDYRFDWQKINLEDLGLPSITFNNDSENNFEFTQLKIGYKSAKRIYLKGELGVSFIDLPKQITLSNVVLTQKLAVDYPWMYMEKAKLLLSATVGVGYRF